MYFQDKDKDNCFLKKEKRLYASPEGNPLFGLIDWYDHELPNRLSFSESWVLNRVYNFTLASWTGCLFRREAFIRAWGLAMSGVHLWYQQFFSKKM